LQLTGVGVDFAVSANGNTTATIAAGGQAVYPLLLTSAAGVPGTVAFACTGVPAHAVCTVNPLSGALGGTATVTVTVATSVAGAGLRWPVIADGHGMVWTCALLPLGLLGLRRKHLRRVGAVMLAGCVLTAMGCAVSRIIPDTSAGAGSVGTPTPSGTYNLVVSGTAAGLTRSVGLTLVVQ
jgi:hypothetical protein